MSPWFNYEATLKILLFSTLAGAALPGLFALGIRLQVNDAGDASTNNATPHRKPILVTLAWVIYALVLMVVILGVLYIVSRDFIAHHTHYPFLGIKP
ncbi:hypothetical protein JK2ML_2259 [Mycobacterium leprae Kyoto-2]|uniref:Possible membrane protein n=3 Tax=Mycobacterium leprae TaxID=1769 RepID=Q9CBB7_MYCLE|nr:hypothetical protein [Mycobacterium leprae]CAR72357.1 possible membrane protein [Mycobacterium leprae Br4923]AWV48563.1 hypothetical protein DIJ64_12390 [Mycobacterium leprae]OAR21179.1 hypothetical protein A8144_01650 [Mycobacterium leprae 3125609]OAX72175.1 hypothetical protein A3216_01720 [Mycobacterium leprae 7935681]CAC31215.1 possible membrane protein [Mycobacterium leprae]